MIYAAQLRAIDNDGLLRLSIAGRELLVADRGDYARHRMGEHVPVQLIIEASQAAEYVNPGDAAFLVYSEQSTVVATGRCSDYLEHDLIRLEGALREGPASVAVRLKAPQQATDFRRGSWLCVRGVLAVMVPAADHDETGLRQ